MTPASPADEAAASVSVRMGLIHRRADWTKAQFLMYWRDTHGPLAARAPNLREYWQNAVVDAHLPRIGLPRGPWDFDGFSQLRFDDPGQAAHAFRDSAMAAALIADEQHFLGGLHIVTTIQEAVVPPPQDAGRCSSSSFCSRGSPTARKAISAMRGSRSGSGCARCPAR